MTRDLAKLDAEVDRKLKASCLPLIEQNKALEVQIAEVIGSTQRQEPPDSIPTRAPLQEKMRRAPCRELCPLGRPRRRKSSPAGDKVSLYYSITRKTAGSPAL